jgi:hypothetical protein
LNKEWESFRTLGEGKNKASDLFERIAAAEPANGYKLLCSFGKYNRCFGIR